MQSSKLDFILLGCQKCATTWLHRCFRAHPEICVNEEDEIHYFDIHYTRGQDWFTSFFSEAQPNQKCGDTTSSTIRSDQALERIAKDYPDVRILLSIRNPIERAFSHYWHEKAKEKIHFQFEEIWSNYDLYDSFVGVGVYADRIKKLLTLFAKEQIQILLMDDLKSDPNSYLVKVFQHIGVDPGYQPKELDLIINRYSHGPKDKRIEGKSEYERGMAPDTRKRLQEIYRDPNQRLATLLGRDLSHWQ